MCERERTRDGDRLRAKRCRIIAVRVGAARDGARPYLSQTPIAFAKQLIDSNPYTYPLHQTQATPPKLLPSYSRARPKNEILPVPVPPK